MNKLNRSTAAAFALTVAVAAGGVSWAQSPEDHAAHHPAQETAPAGMPMSGQGGGMPMMSGMMGGDMQQMMRMMQMMRERMARMEMGGPMGTMGYEHVEGRIAFLKAELAVTEAQQPQWNAFADALRAQARTMQAAHGEMMQGGMQGTWPDRLAREEKALSAHLDSLKAIEAPARALYAVLSPEQQKKADELMVHPMMGRM
jgi:hypothetical protein